MINKVMGSVIPKMAHATAKKAVSGNAEKGSRLTRFLQSETLGKVLDVAADNPVICQSLFSLAVCCGARPVTNFAITKDKGDATYASCHSISSGVIGFAWPLVFATPLAVGVKRVLAKPHKYLKPEMVKKFYPNVGLVDILGKDGKAIGKKIATNTEGEMLRKDGSVLCKDLEPLMIYGKEEKAAFEATHNNLMVDKSGVVRSKTVFKTEKGVIKKDKDGNNIGCAVQKDLTPITEEMEIGVKKEQNVKNFVNMSADIILATPRAALTIAFIPPILNLFGVKKKPKGDAAQANTQNNQTINVISASNNTVQKTGGNNIASAFNSFKKGGV